MPRFQNIYPPFAHIYMMANERDESKKYMHNNALEGDKATIPVVEERVVIDTKSRVTQEVSVEKKIHTKDVNLPLTDIHTSYREERIPVNREVKQIPEIRYEGDNLIIPIVREEEVVIKRLMLVEEIHLIKEVTRSEHTETIKLRSEEVDIQRHSPPKNTI